MASTIEAGTSHGEKQYAFLTAEDYENAPIEPFPEYSEPEGLFPLYADHESLPREAFLPPSRHPALRRCEAFAPSFGKTMATTTTTTTTRTKIVKTTTMLVPFKEESKLDFADVRAWNAPPFLLYMIHAAPWFLLGFCGLLFIVVQLQ